MSYEKVLKDLFEFNIIAMFYLKYILYCCFNAVFAIAPVQFLPKCVCSCMTLIKKVTLQNWQKTVCLTTVVQKEQSQLMKFFM